MCYYPVANYTSFFRITSSIPENNMSIGAQLVLRGTIIASSLVAILCFTITAHFSPTDSFTLTSFQTTQSQSKQDASLTTSHTVVFIQCVGSRIPERPYCSKICCTSSIKSALRLKEMNPHVHVYIVYRDMRPYGLREDLYREARSKGISFVRYDFEQDVTVTKEQQFVCIQFTVYFAFYLLNFSFIIT